jgi:hypothetical protein
MTSCDAYACALAHELSQSLGSRLNLQPVAARCIQLSIAAWNSGAENNALDAIQTTTIMPDTNARAQLAELINRFARPCVTAAYIEVGL